MFGRIVFSALLSGVVAGLLITVIQLFTVIPMVLKAETFEGGAVAGAQAHAHADHGQPGHSHANDGHSHGDDEWAPGDGAERTLYTALTNTLAAIGFAFLLGAAFAVFNHANWRDGILWGLGGFAAFQLAPALGLPPELPGTVGAELGLRQVWWVSTAMATAAGLGCIAFGKTAALRVIGAALILAPHLIGAPHPETFSASVPPELASAFVVNTLVVGGIFWVMLGGLMGLAFSKIR